MEEISIKIRRYYFFNDMVNVKHFDLRVLEIRKLSCKSANINICHIEYMTMKGLDHVARECAEIVHFYFIFILFIYSFIYFAFDGDFLAGGLGEVYAFCAA